ncbi:hypothetical protein E3N88_13524 [Mikania micrantha]|uniref:Uncharacterized protein n=1 Tax=Mikania micrantha TaxID=192012 RepID=A0A5N6P8U7_9ASTR|nr:hypothetical protein E3N88_13524 [Mikania micrantha]
MHSSDRKINDEDRLDLLPKKIAMAFNSIFQHLLDGLHSLLVFIFCTMKMKMAGMIRRVGLGVCYTMHCCDRKVNDQDRIDLLPKIIAKAFNSIFQHF